MTSPNLVCVIDDDVVFALKVVAMARSLSEGKKGQASVSRIVNTALRELMPKLFMEVPHLEEMIRDHMKKQSSH